MNDTSQPLGDGRIQITVIDFRGEDPTKDWGDGTTGLLTVRGKDHGLTAEQFDAMADACREAAQRIREYSP